MKINIYSIAKQRHDEYEVINLELKKMVSRFAKVKDIALFNNGVTKAQNRGVKEAQSSYSKLFKPNFGGGYNIALDVNGKLLDSIEFSKFFNDTMAVNFFIGGAYGFSEEFLQKCDERVSLSKLTMSHKVAKVVLLEQIYRGLSILRNHPYHK